MNVNPGSVTTDYYNDYWTENPHWMPAAELSSLQRQLFLRLVKPESVVLDLGCGDGSHYGAALSQIARAYYGLDVSQVAVDKAGQNGILAQCHDLGQALPYPDAMFDTIICVEVLEHLFDPSFTLSEMKRMLKPTGQIILSVPNIVHLSNRVRVLLGGFSPGGTPETSSRRQWADPHIRFFTLRTLRAFVAEQNLHIRELYGEGFGIFSTFPVLSSLAARFVGWRRLESWSHPFEFLARWLPSLCAGHLIAIVTHKATDAS